MPRGKRSKAKAPVKKSSSDPLPMTREDENDRTDVNEEVETPQERSTESVSEDTSQNLKENGQQASQAPTLDNDSDGEGDTVWTPEREDRLIDLFKECTFLYDKNVPAFQQRNKKEMAHARFAAILGVTGMPLISCYIFTFKKKNVTRISEIYI